MPGRLPGRPGRCEFPAVLPGSVPGSDSATRTSHAAGPESLTEQHPAVAGGIVTEPGAFDRLIPLSAPTGNLNAGATQSGPWHAASAPAPAAAAGPGPVLWTQ